MCNRVAVEVCGGEISSEGEQSVENAIVAFFNLAKLGAKLLAARKITLSSRMGDPQGSQASLFWDRLRAITQPAEKINGLLAYS